MHKFLRISLLSISLLLVISMLAWISNELYHQSTQTSLAERNIKIKELVQEARHHIERSLSAFITFEQSRGYYEYQTQIPHKRPYDQRLDPPRPHEVASESPLCTYLPSPVKAYIQINPQGEISGPAIQQEIINSLNKSPNLYKVLNNKIKTLTSLPSSGDLWVDLANEMLHKGSTPPPAKQGELTRISGISAFVPITHDNNLFILRKLYTNRGDFIQGALLDLKLLSIPEHIKSALPHCYVNTYNWSTTNKYPLHDSNAQFFHTVPLVFFPGDKINISTASNSQILNWTLLLIWSLVLLGSAGLIWLLLHSFKLQERQAEFVSAVTHELRTPLTSVSLFAELLLENNVPEQKRNSYYEKILSECHRLEHLVENVLAYSRLQRKAIPRAKDFLTLQELFEPLAEKIERRLLAEEMSFSWALAPNIRILPIKTDALAVEQILDNLTTNAIKYAKVPNAKIHLTIQADTRFVLIRFRDNGPGIEPSKKKLIFKPFRRTKSAAESKQPGVGLGLALAREQARSLGGDLKLEAAGVSGACFLLSLPKA